MRQDNKPYTMRLLINFIRRLYTRWRIVPQFDSVGAGLEIIGAHRLEIYGRDIHLGNNVHLQTARGQMSRLCTWPNGESGNGKSGNGKIEIGDNVLLTPGLHIVSANHVKIGDNVMIASRVYISDADWHGIDNRLATPGAHAPIMLEDNVWLGEGVKICKGVTIGKNSVIGAGSVVTRTIEANVIAAGNPAKMISKIDETNIQSRANLFADNVQYQKTMRYLHYQNHKNNSYLSWLWHIIFPNRRS